MDKTFVMDTKGKAIAKGEWKTLYMDGKIRLGRSIELRLSSFCKK
jgi:hypothetical protein